MIELQMVARMLRRGLLLAPFVVFGCLVFGDTKIGYSAAIGIAMALVNLWIAGRVIGGIADNKPQMLLAGAMIAFMLGLALLTGLALLLQAFDIVTFPVTGLVLVGTHLVLVAWEAARTYPVSKLSPAQNALKARSH